MTNNEEQLSDVLELVHIGSFDKKKLTFSEPETMEIKGNDDEAQDEEGAAPSQKGGETATYMKCAIFYRLSDGKRGSCLVSLPPSFCFGLSEDYAYGKKRTDANFRGYSLAYYYKDPKETKNSKPKAAGLDYANADQKKILLTWTQVQEVLTAHLAENSDALPDKCVILARNHQLVSPIARYPKKETVDQKGKKRKVPDLTKPLRSYFRLLYSKKSDTFASTFYDGNNEEIDPRKLIGIRGIITPVVKVDWVYIGDAVASVQIKLWEAIYEPQEPIVRTRLLAPTPVKISVDAEEIEEPEIEDTASNEFGEPEEPIKPKGKLVVKATKPAPIKAPPGAAKKSVAPPPKKSAAPAKIAAPPKKIAPKKSVAPPVETEEEDESFEL